MTKEINAFLGALPQEEIKKWLDYGKQIEHLPKHLQTIKFDRKEYFKKLTDKQIDKIVSDDLSNALGRNLHELKNFVEYDLNLDKFDSASAFWKLVGNPIYRMHEKSIVEECRDSSRYKEKLFSKIEVMKREISNK